jgi:hypothetical protein
MEPSQIVKQKKKKEKNIFYNFSQKTTLKFTQDKKVQLIYLIYGDKLQITRSPVDLLLFLDLKELKINH